MHASLAQSFYSKYSFLYTPRGTNLQLPSCHPLSGVFFLLNPIHRCTRATPCGLLQALHLWGQALTRLVSLVFLFQEERASPFCAGWHQSVGGINQKEQSVCQRNVSMQKHIAQHNCGTERKIRASANPQSLFTAFSLHPRPFQQQLIPITVKRLFFPGKEEHRPQQPSDLRANLYLSRR